MVKVGEVGVEAHRWILKMEVNMDTSGLESFVLGVQERAGIVINASPYHVPLFWTVVVFGGRSFWVEIRSVGMDGRHFSHRKGSGH